MDVLGRDAGRAQRGRRTRGPSASKLRSTAPTGGREAGPGRAPHRRPALGWGRQNMGAPRRAWPPGALQPEEGPTLDVSEEDQAEFPQGRQRWSRGEEAKNGVEMALKNHQVHFLWQMWQMAGGHGQTCITGHPPRLGRGQLLVWTGTLYTHTYLQKVTYFRCHYITHFFAQT